MIAFFVWIIGLLGTVVLIAGGLTYILVTLANRRLGPVLVPAGMLYRCYRRRSLVWTLVSRDWALPFSKTLAATVNAEKYGHALEHSAEAIVIWIVFGAVVGSAAGGFLAHIAGHRLGQRTVMQNADGASRRHNHTTNAPSPDELCAGTARCSHFAE